MKTHVLGYENPRFLIVKRRFMIGKTRFYYLLEFRKWMLMVVKVARHTPNRNLSELTEVGLP